MGGNSILLKDGGDEFRAVRDDFGRFHSVSSSLEKAMMNVEVVARRQGPSCVWRCLRASKRDFSNFCPSYHFALSAMGALKRDCCNSPVSLIPRITPAAKFYYIPWYEDENHIILAPCSTSDDLRQYFARSRRPRKGDGTRMGTTESLLNTLESHDRTKVTSNSPSPGWDVLESICKPEGWGFPVQGKTEEHMGKEQVAFQLSILKLGVLLSVAMNLTAMLAHAHCLSAQSTSP